MKDEAAEYLPGSRPPNLKIFITSDLHSYFAGEQDYDAIRQIEAGGDGKMIFYSSHIAEAFINDVLIEKPDAVILSGDLTLNGEKDGHLRLAALLKQIEDAGIKVLVIPGNHDINNPFASEIKDGKLLTTEYITPGQFREIYRHCGYEGASYYDKNTLSYIFRLNDYLYAVMLDTAVYKNNLRTKQSYSGGKISEATFKWLERAVASIRNNNNDAQFIAVLHHNLFVHNRMFETDYVIGNANKAVKKFLEMGINIFFSGHIHIQHILTKKAENDRTMTEIVNGSLVTYPVIYGVAEFDRNGMNYHTTTVDMAGYAEQKGSDDKNLMNFEQYSESVFSERTGRNMARRLKGLGYSDEVISEALYTMKQINAHYFAGRVDEILDELKSQAGYQILMSERSLRSYMTSILTDGRGENNQICLGWP